MTITGSNDVPKINSVVPQTIAFLGGTSVAGGDLTAHVPTSGTILFDDPDLTDTHTVKVADPVATLTDPTTQVTTPYTLPPTPLAIFNQALTASITDAIPPSDRQHRHRPWIDQLEPCRTAGLARRFHSQGRNPHADLRGDRDGLARRDRTRPSRSPLRAPTRRRWSGSRRRGGTREDARARRAVEQRRELGNRQRADFRRRHHHHRSARRPDADLSGDDRCAGIRQVGDNERLRRRQRRRSSTIRVRSRSAAPSPSMPTPSVYNFLGATISIGGMAEFLDHSLLVNSGTLLLAGGGDFGRSAGITNTRTIELVGGILNVFARSRTPMAAARPDHGRSPVPPRWLSRRWH